MQHSFVPRQFALFAGILALAGFSAGSLPKAVSADDPPKDEKPKYTIKEVMKKAHTPDGGILKKIVAGKATKEDAEQLVELYISLGQNKPPQGEPDSWKKKTGGLLEAAKDVVADKKGAREKLEKAANCANCHKVHKPPAK